MQAKLGEWSGILYVQFVEEVSQQRELRKTISIIDGWCCGPATCNMLGEGGVEGETERQRH